VALQRRAEAGHVGVEVGAIGIAVEEAGDGT
jgi:hypothetical protein